MTAGGRPSVAMLLENNIYPDDVRVRAEAESLAAAGYAVRVIAPRGPGQAAREVVRGVQVERYRQPEGGGEDKLGLLVEYAVAHLQLLPRALRALARGADVVHLHNPPDTLFPAGILGRLLGRRVVFDQHDLSADLFEAKFGASPLVAVLRALQRASARWADLVLVTNQSQREMLVTSVPRAAGDVVLVRNGPLRADIPEELPIRAGSLRDPHLVYVGVLGSQDGVDRLPDLLDRLVHGHGLDAARLTVVGFGSEEEPLARALRERGLADHAVMTGRVSHMEAMRIIASADICLDTAVCNPFNHRSTMVKVIEYLALARPTVAFALRETVNTAGDAACFAPCGDWDAFAELVAELARSEELRRDMSRRATGRREMLLWERSEAELLGAYRRMLAR